MFNDNLTDTAIKAAIRAAVKHATKPKKLPDGKGLSLLVKPNGSALWRFKYSMPRYAHGNLISFGAYPDVPLKAARDKRDEARKLIAAGRDPSEVRQEAKHATANTFAQVAEEYISKQTNLAPRTITKARWQLRLLPEISRRPINEISAKELLAALRKIEARGLTETPHKTKELCGRVFMYGVACGLCERNVAADLKLALKPRPEQHLAAITDPVKVGQLLRDIDKYVGQPATKAALRLLPHVFLRAAELRNGQWPEIDWSAALWRIPGSRMKAKREHLVPLSKQALAILRELQPITGEGYMFPAIGPKQRPISENTLGYALHGLGYSSDVHVPHGFRSTASTLLHELGWDSRDIELQLAHADSNKIRGIYNRAERIKERTRMMQQWSDYLDQLRTGDANKVVPFKKHA
jgi:integrase